MSLLVIFRKQTWDGIIIDGILLTTGILFLAERFSKNKEDYDRKR